MNANQVIACIGALCFICAARAVAAVSMISVEHRVWGDAGDSPANTYNESGSVAVSGNANGSIQNPFFTEYFYASSSASDWSVNAYRIGNAIYANAYAQNTYVFRPSSRELTIALNGQIGDWWLENDAQMTLTDLRDNSLVGIYQSPSYTGISPFPDDPYASGGCLINWEMTVELDPENEYELIIYVGAHRGEGGEGSASLSLTLVPEPAGVLLVGMAAMGFCLLRQRPGNIYRASQGSQLAS